MRTEIQLLGSRRGRSVCAFLLQSCGKERISQYNRNYFPCTIFAMKNIVTRAVCDVDGRRGPMFPSFPEIREACPGPGSMRRLWRRRPTCGVTQCLTSPSTGLRGPEAEAEAEADAEAQAGPVSVVARCRSGARRAGAAWGARTRASATPRPRNDACRSRPRCSSAPSSPSPT